MINIFRGFKGKLLFLVIVGCLYYFIPLIKVNVNQAFFILSNVDVGMARDYILGFGIWAPIVSFFLMVFQSIAAPLPAFIITFANAGLFGWVYGAILSWSSAMAGAVLCFYIARYLGRDTVERLTSVKALKTIDDFFKYYGKYAILIARLLPFISFDVVSYAAVVSMSPEIAALAPDKKHCRPLSERSPLPPARRMDAAGIKKRKTATIRHISSLANILLFA
jgi:uncharacterized membrane protein YdjX (TVP38/TMEM64 family)